MATSGHAADAALAADIVIVGGGLAGLSLACHLLQQGIGARRLLVLEARNQYTHDRYWCSWADTQHPFANCVEAEWQRWGVAFGDRSHVQTCAEQPYRCIPSGRFYAEAVRQLTAAPNAELRLGCGVSSTRDLGNAAEVELVDGTRLRAGMVFDSRPDHGSDRLTTAALEVDWLQDFLGWRVRCEQPVFDAGTVTLMRFEPSLGDVRFLYLLPFSAREALVESTAFAPRPVPDSEHEDLLRRHLVTALAGSAYEVLERERGRVPMTTRRSPVRRAGARVVPIGTAAGMVKPSTGYSFESVQRWSRQVAADLAAGRPFLAPAPRGRGTLAMDRMFLAFLRRHPERMPAVFVQMFATVAPATLVRFLSDRGSLRDAMAVALALPMLPMLGEALRSLRLWARSA